MLSRGIPRDVVKTIDGYGGGDWGKAYDPFLIQCDELGSINIPALKLVDGVTLTELPIVEICKINSTKSNAMLPQTLLTPGTANLNKLSLC